MRNRRLLVEEGRLADELIVVAKAHGRHQLAHFLGHEEEVVDDMLRLALEALPELRVLRGHTHGASVQVALAHHDAARSDQRCRGKADLVSTQQRRDHDVAARADAAVGLHRDAAAQVVGHQRLLSLSQADLPRQARMLD